MAVVVVSAGPVTAGPPGAEAAQVELVALPREFVAMAEWATDRFERAALELPPLRFVYHHGDRTPCRDRDGLHHPVDGINVIEICTTEPSFPTRVMILHETAHAWTDHALTSQRKAAFQDLRGWEYWRNYEDADWHENGTEQAAEIMVWGLIDRPIRIVRIFQNTCDQLNAGYRTLTGTAPLNTCEQ
jgi:hypothetical protein